MLKMRNHGLAEDQIEEASISQIHLLNQKVEDLNERVMGKQVQITSPEAPRRFSFLIQILSRVFQ